MNKIIAFDLDGTLIDSAPDIANALNQIMLSNNLKEVPLKEIRSMIGSGARILIKHAFANQNMRVKDLNNLTEEFLVIYKKCFINCPKTYKNGIYIDDIIKVAKKLKMKISVIEDDVYINLGTPSLIKDFIFWFKFYYNKK